MEINVNKIIFACDYLPVDRLLMLVETGSFGSLQQAVNAEATLFGWFLPRSKLNFHRYLPSRLYEHEFTFKSGYKIERISYPAGFKLVMEYSPEKVDRMRFMLPSGHPSDPLSYRVLVGCGSSIDIDKNDLKIKSRG